MKTKAAVLVGINKPLEIQELNLPALEAGQCLVRIEAAGICRTQLSEQAGLKGEDPYIPHLLGHEAAGHVEDIGKGVTKIKPGDYVVVSWIKGKGADVGGAKYTNDGGQVIQSGAAAVFTRHTIVAENRLTPISQQIPAQVAALLGCAIPTGVGVVLKTLSLTKDQSVVIFGVGGVGGAAILGAKIAGCNPIIAVDITNEKLKHAKMLGATHTVLNHSNDVTEFVRSILQNGADAAVEATGIPKVAEAAFNILGKKGRLAIAGHPAKGKKISLDPFMFIEGRSVVGTWGGDIMPDRDIPHFAQLYLDGKLPIEKLITHSYRLEQVNEALEIMRGGSAGRVVLKIED